MPSTNFRATLGPRHKELLDPVMECLKESKEPLTVEGVRARLGKQKGAYLGIRTLLVHLEKSGELSVRMIEGRAYYSIRRKCAQDLDTLSRELGVGLEWICRGSTYLLRVVVGPQTASFSLRLGQDPSTVTEDWIREKAERGKSTLSRSSERLRQVDPPVGPRDSGIPVEDLLRGAVERRKNRFTAYGLPSCSPGQHSATPEPPAKWSREGAVMHRIFISWLVSVMIGWVPPGRPVEHFPEARETAEEAVARYHEIARDLLDVAFDPEEEPLFRGEDWKARANTALLLSAIALKESGFRRDVDLGKGKMARGDQGRSVCLMQINVGKGTVPLHGEPGTWSAEDLVSDRKKCFRAALHLVRRSFSACRGELGRRLASYTSGDCSKGHQASENRIRAYLRARGRHPLTLPSAP